MNKKILISLLLLILVILLVFLYQNIKNKPFYLEDKYYVNEIIEIDSKEYSELVKKKESFAVALYKPNCGASSAFLEVLNEFSSNYKISIYKMTFEEMKKTKLKIKYYPSLALINKGRLVDYLESDKDSDIKYYKTSEGFNEWFRMHVLVK